MFSQLVWVVSLITVYLRLFLPAHKKVTMSGKKRLVEAIAGLLKHETMIKQTPTENGIMLHCTT